VIYFVFYFYEKSYKRNAIFNIREININLLKTMKAIFIFVSVSCQLTIIIVVN